MSDYATAIYAAIAVTAALSAAVVYVLAQPTDLPVLKKTRPKPDDVNRRPVQGTAEGCRPDVHGFQVHRARLKRAGTSVDDPEFSGGDVGRLLIQRRTKNVQCTGIGGQQLTLRLDG